MKAKVKKLAEVDVMFVRIEIAPRYIGDSEDDDMPSDFPLLNDIKTLWQATVNVDTGLIHEWPEGQSREMHVKVCDAGTYTLLDVNGETVAEINGYVPNRLVPGSYGDYVELKINESGFITNWPKNPDISEFFNSDDED